MTDTLVGTSRRWLGVAVLFVGTALAGVGPGPIRAATIKPPAVPALRVMPLGDSLTAGAGADPNAHQSYRGHLYNTLQSAGYAVDFVGSDTTPTLAGGDADNEGHGGYTIGPDASQYCTRAATGELQCQPQHFNLSDNVGAWLAAARPDVVLLLVGVNDQYPTDVTPATSGLLRPVNPDDAPAKLTSLVGRLAASATQPWVFVASLIPLSGAVTTPSIDALNTAARTLGSSSPTDKVVFVDLATLVLSPADYNDGLHLSDSGATKVADVWFRALQATLRAPAPGTATSAAGTPVMTTPVAPGAAPPVAAADPCAAAITPPADETAIAYTVSASSAVAPAERIEDGRGCADDSRWIAAAADPQTLVLQTRANVPARIVRILWDRSSAASFVLESSKDGRTWRRVTSVTRNTNDADQFITAYRLPGTGAPYLRLRSMVRTPQAKAGQWGVSIRELVLSAPVA